MSRTKYLLLTLILIFTTTCSTVPLTGRKQLTPIPASQMLALSKDSYAKVLDDNRLSNNVAYTSQVNRVGNRISDAVEKYLAMENNSNLIEGYVWEFNVLASDKKNAWCMPGGKIAFYEGIMPVCKDDAGVATVMAHEIAHALAKHGNERLSQQLAVQLGGTALSMALEEKPETTQQIAMLAFGAGSSLGLILPYSRLHEKEADELGLYFMAMAGYNPEMAPEFWKRMLQEGENPVPEFLSTHPNPSSRIKNINKNMPQALEYYNNASDFLTR